MLNWSSTWHWSWWMQNCTFRHKLGDHVLNVLALRHLVQFFQLFQNMTTRLVNNSKIPLQKGAGYNLDLAAVGGNTHLSKSLWSIHEKQKVIILEVNLWSCLSPLPICNIISGWVTSSSKNHLQIQPHSCRENYTFKDSRAWSELSNVAGVCLCAVIVGLTSLFGLPWMVASAVPSLNHVRSLVTLSKSMHIRFNLSLSQNHIFSKWKNLLQIWLCNSITIAQVTVCMNG